MAARSKTAGVSTSSSDTLLFHRAVLCFYAPTCGTIKGLWPNPNTLGFQDVNPLHVGLLFASGSGPQLGSALEKTKGRGRGGRRSADCAETRRLSASGSVLSSLPPHTAVYHPPSSCMKSHTLWVCFRSLLGPLACPPGLGRMLPHCLSLQACLGGFCHPPPRTPLPPRWPRVRPGAASSSRKRLMQPQLSTPPSPQHPLPGQGIPKALRPARLPPWQTPAQGPRA